MLRSLRVGQILGAEIKLHWSLPLVALLPLLTSPSRSLESLGSGLGAVVLLVLSVFLHEFGHTLAARACGIPVRSIVLWPLGGFATLGREPARLRHQLAIIAAGPAVNLAVAALLFGGGLLLTTALAPSLLLFDGPPALGLAWRAATALLVINLMLGTLNLVPIYPLDGGRIAYALLQRFAGSAWASRVMLVVSVPLAVAFVAFVFVQGSWLDLPLGALLLLGAATLHPGARQRIGMGVLWLTNRPAYHMHRGDLERAQRLVDAQLARNPDDVRAHTTRGWIAHARKDAPAMLAAASRALELQPESAATRAAHGYAAHLAGDDELAEASLARALALDPGFGQAHTVRGMIGLARNDLAAALAAFEAALASQAAQAERGLGLNNRADIRLLLGDEAGAAADIEQAVALAPELYCVYLTRGELRLRRRELQAALADFDHALRLHPSEVEGYLFRSQVAAALGDAARAHAELERAVAVHREQALVRQEYWLAAWAAGQLPWALEVYGQLISRDPACAAAYHGRADALRVNGLPAEAIADYSRALALEPGRAGAYLGRARARLALGEPAAPDLELALAHASTPNQRRDAWALLGAAGLDVPAGTTSLAPAVS